MSSASHVAFHAGARAAIGAPALVLIAGMLGFGALGHSSGLSLVLTTASSAFIYALPGQVVLTELLSLSAAGAAGVSAMAIALAVTLTAARFLTMALTLYPQMPRSSRRLSLWGWTHFLSMTSWAECMKRYGDMPADQRMPFFAGFGLVCWGVSVPATSLGFLLAGHMPTPLTLGLVFLNPLFFLLSFTEVKPWGNRLSIVLGGVMGPLVYAYSPSYSLLASGLVAGTLAYALDRWRRRRPASRA